MLGAVQPFPQLRFQSPCWSCHTSPFRLPDFCLKSLHESRERRAKGFTDSAKFDHIKATFASFVFTDETLRPSQDFGQLDLCQAFPSSDIPQEISEDGVL